MIGLPLQKRIAANLPDPVLQAKRWLLWRNEDGRKVPYYANGARRQGKLDTPADLKLLVTFDEAVNAYLVEDYTGFGFALVGEDGIGGFDLDKCLNDEGLLKEDHASYGLVCRAMVDGAYIEVTPSGRGLRIVGPCGVTEAYSKDGLEYWGSGRFVTITGDVWVNPKGWQALGHLRTPLGTHTKPVSERSGGEDEDGPLVSISELRDALAAFPSDERDLWVRMGHALKTLPNDKGKALWLEWSAKSDKFTEADALVKWDGFRPTSTDHKAVFAEAYRHGWTPKRKRERIADEAPSPSGRVPFDLGDKPEFRPTEFVLDGFLPAQVAVIAGAWGAGKSTNLIPLIASVAHLAPESWGFRPTLRRHVVWISEAPEQAHDTLLSLHRAEGAAPWGEFVEWFHLYPARREPAKKIAADAKALSEQYTWTTDAGFNVKPLIVLDTITANIDLENENDNSQAAAAMAALKQTLRGSPLVLIGHTPKALVRADLADMTFRGAGAWEAEAAATYFLVWDQDTDMRFLAIRKARFAPTYREIDFGHEGGSVILPTPWGEPQSKHYVHGVPTKSNGEARKAARQEVLEERREERNLRARNERQERILGAIRQFAAEGRLATRKTIRDALGGKKELLLDAVNQLVEAELVREHPITIETVEAFALDLKPPYPDLLLPKEVDCEAFFERLRKGNQL